MFNRVTIVPLVGLVFAFLAWLNVALPASMTEDATVAVVMIGVGVLTLIGRILHGEADVDGVKVWWRSKVVWTQIATFGIAALALFGVTVAGLSVEGVVALAMVVTTGLSAILGAGPSAALRA